mgnify:CR=1 FL=1
MSDSILWMDSNEPREVEQLLRPLVPQVVVVPLNVAGHADYLWIDRKGNRRQWERKQLPEALGDLDALEEQLNREMLTCEELVLSVEGVGMQTASGVQTFLKRGNVWVAGWHCPPNKARPQPGLYQRWLSLKWSFKACGVDVEEPVDTMDFAARLATAYKQSMVEKHTTFRRYVRPHIEPFHADLQVEQMMRLKDAGMGAVTAEKMIARFGTLHKAVTASYGELVGCLGGAGARKFLAAIGREA